MKAKTMVYLERAELEALRAQARKHRISLAEAVRRAVRMSLDSGGAPAPIAPAAYEAIVGLGTSGRADISQKHDVEIAKALKARRRVR